MKMKIIIGLLVVAIMCSNISAFRIVIRNCSAKKEGVSFHTQWEYIKGEDYDRDKGQHYITKGTADDTAKIGQFGYHEVGTGETGQNMKITADGGDQYELKKDFSQDFAGSNGGACIFYKDGRGFVAQKKRGTEQAKLYEVQQGSTTADWGTIRGQCNCEWEYD